MTERKNEIVLVLAFRDFNRWYRGRMDFLIKSTAKQYDVVILNFPQKWVRKNLSKRADFEFFPSNVKIIDGYPISAKNPISAEVLNLLPNIFLLRKLSKEYKFDKIIIMGSLILPIFSLLWNKTKAPMLFDFLDYYPATFNLLLTEFHGAQKLSHLINSLVRKIGRSAVKFTIDSCIKRSKVITAASNSLKTYTEAFSVKSFFIPNGIDSSSTIIKNRDELRTKLKINDKFVLGYLGIVAKARRLDIMLTAMSENKFENTIIMIVGEGPALNLYKKLVKDLKIENFVIFVGSVSKELVNSYISCMDICVISLEKGELANMHRPVKFLEYLSNKKPILITNSTELEQDYPPEKFPFIRYYNDPESFSKSFNELRLELNNIKTTKQLSDFSFDIKQKYSWENLGNQFVQILQNMNAGK